MTKQQRIDDHRHDSSRRTSLDVPSVSNGDEISVTAAGETFRGDVARVDTYGETTGVERVIQFTLSHNHRIDGPDWEPWQAFFVEESAGVYRLNVQDSDGSRPRTRNLDAPTTVTVNRR